MGSADISVYLTENQQLFLYQEVQIQIAFKSIISNCFNFFVSLKVVLINMVAIFMSAKLAAFCLLKIKVFGNKVYVIISANDVTNKTLSSRDSNYIAYVVM